MEINRIIYKELASEISKPFISILIGPRQVGKTFLMRQLEAECRRNGLKTLFHNLEDLMICALTAATNLRQMVSLPNTLW